MRTTEQIIDLLEQRTQAGQSRQHTMNQLAALYHGRITVPLPELNREEQPAVANLMMQAAEQKAMRIASVDPVTKTFAMGQGPSHVKNAQQRKRAFRSLHERNGLERKMRIRARWMSVYSAAPVIIMPEWSTETNPRGLDDAKWLLIDPRGFYPSTDHSDPSDPVKDDVIVHTVRSLGWMRRAYPSMAAEISQPHHLPDETIDWILYADHEQITVIASRKVGVDEQVPMMGVRSGTEVLTLHNRRISRPVNSMPNYTGEPVCISPGGLSLTSEPIGRFDQIVGMYKRMAEIDALSRIALQKSIFSEAWAVSNPGETARIVRSPQPLEGIAGIVEGGSINFRQVDAQLTGRVGIVDLERAIRQTGMIPAEYGGELPTNARTARQGGRLLSNIVDFDIAEAQSLFAEARMHENRIAAMTQKRLWGGMEKTIEYEAGEDVYRLKYDPEKLWTTFGNRVSYALAGADSGGSVIGAGQRQGMGTLSRETFMEVDPMVKDVDIERQRIDSERIKDAVMSRIQNEAAAPEGESPWNSDDLMYFFKRMDEGNEMLEAYEDMQERKRKQQSETAPMGDPATMPGVAPGSEMPAEVPPSIMGPTESSSNVTSLLGRLRLAQQVVPGELPA